jgi:Uma2 family endonuclease
MGLVALKNEDLPHYTYDDYVQWEGRWEIINGIPYAMYPAPSKKHQRVSLNIARQLESLLESNSCANCTTYLPIDWVIAEDIVVQPDVLVVCGDNPEETRLTITPVLVFEIVSPTTAQKDKVLKYRLYEHAGVKYYCIVDPVSKSAEIYSLDYNEKKYREMEDFHEGKIIFDLGNEGCRIAFDFSKIF